MNKLLLIFIAAMLIFSCVGKHKSNAQKARMGKDQIKQNTLKTDTLQVDLRNSNIHWKGTKMRGAGKHEGELQLRSAYILSENGKIVGGRFVADMTSIGVTDIPEHEPVPIRNLNNHLKSEGFFEVENYPISKFEITKIDSLQNDSILVSGNLTIKDVTRNIEFRATNTEREFSTKFTFDRFQWNITYEGSWADKTLVDKDIELTINLKIAKESTELSTNVKAEIKNEIQAEVDEGVVATRTKNIELYMSQLPDDLKIYNESDEIISREKQREYALRDWEIIDTTLRIMVQIDSIQYLRADSVVVSTYQEWERMMFQRDGVKTDTVLTTQRHKETWRKTPKGWFAYEVKELGGQVFINGKNYNPNE